MAGQGTMDQPDREAENASRMAKVFYPLGNLLLLKTEPLRGEDGVGLGCGFGAQSVHEARELAVADAAVVASGQVVRLGPIEASSAAFCNVAVEQTVFVEVARAISHDLPPEQAAQLPRSPEQMDTHGRFVQSRNGAHFSRRPVA